MHQSTTEGEGITCNQTQKQRKGHCRQKGLIVADNRLGSPHLLHRSGERLLQLDVYTVIPTDNQCCYTYPYNFILNTVLVNSVSGPELISD